MEASHSCRPRGAREQKQLMPFLENTLTLPWILYQGTILIGMVVKGLSHMVEMSTTNKEIHIEGVVGVHTLVGMDLTIMAMGEGEVIRTGETKTGILIEVLVEMPRFSSRELLLGPSLGAHLLLSLHLLSLLHLYLCAILALLLFIQVNFDSS